MSKFFGGKDPFDDPFFTDPYAGMYHEQTQFGNQSKDVTIEEVDSDGNPLNPPSEPSKDVVVRNPSGKKDNNKNPNGQNANGSKIFCYQRVSYGGINGTYYTASVTRKAADDGVIFTEINEEDKSAGEALNTVSRGVRDKGHSATTRRTSEGKMDTMQTLHNLNEDELVGFEETWKTSSQSLPPDWKNGSNLLEDAGSFGRGWDWWPRWGSLMLPWTDYPGDAEPSDGRSKKVVRINVE